MGTTGKLTMNPKPPTVVMLVGLQGSGKTTACGKLARHLKSQGLQPLLVAADLQRPAAVTQLQVLGEQVGVPVYSEPTDPVSVARNARNEAARLGKNVVVLDTAGRLQIDEALMDELRRMRESVQPDNVLLVVDAMTGQEAVSVAESFAETVGIDGVVLTKLDGDARGGAALSVKEVTGKPILFAGIGEKLVDFEPFHPDRMAGRILGMGDVLTLIEKAEASFDEDQAVKAAAKIKKGSFTLEDFLEQMQQVKKMGPLQNIIGMIPGMPKELKNTQIDDKELGKVEAIIRSMTPEERNDSTIINGSRRLRIAQGSGTTTQDVNALLKQFKMVQGMMKQMAGVGGKKGRLPEDAEPRRFPGDAVGRRRCCNLSRLSLNEKVVVPWSRSASCGWARRSSRRTGSSWPTPALPATGASWRSSGSTGPGKSRPSSTSTTSGRWSGSARARSRPSRSNGC